MEVDYPLYTSHLEEKKRISKRGVEYWLARDLQRLLAYNEWRSFEGVIEKAIEGCHSAGLDSNNHFVHVHKKVEIGSGAQRGRADWFLTRYACYLIAMNGDARKPEIGFAQTYFAIQTRRQEIHDQETLDRRLDLRGRMKEANKSLASTAKKAGVRRYGVFQDAGYKGLYNGLGLEDIKELKRIGSKESLLDRIGATELAANYFRATQADEKIVRERVHGEQEAIDTHREVGREVRKAIARIGGAMPEALPAAPSIKKLAARHGKLAGKKSLSKSPTLPGLDSIDE